ncbi:MAG: antitoxin [Candidatus Solibacter usitatus]|nr:antitoxin [Candidatus Solibacter usitatus]
MSKVTLSVEQSVVVRAKRYARKRGTSVSKLVEAYLDMLSEPLLTGNDPPVLRSLRGTLRKAAPDNYRKHLARKYR